MLANSLLLIYVAIAVIEFFRIGYRLLPDALAPNAAWPERVLLVLLPATLSAIFWPLYAAHFIITRTTFWWVTDNHEIIP
jgi:hypothetical protein